MKPARLGTPSRAEVRKVSRHGLWILVEGTERFVAFDLFPWFVDVPIGRLLDVQLQGPGHLYWPKLDVDLAVESIDSPERFPLVSMQQPNKRANLPKRRVR